MAARRADAGELTAVAFAAKAHWGYPRHWLARWSSVLTITDRFLGRNPSYAAIADGRIIGFYSMRLGRRSVWLEQFWVLPRFIGKGVGRLLFAHFERRARQAGAVRVIVESDPHAEGFYRAMGAKTYSRRPAPMDGHVRFLPLLAKALA